MGVYDATVFRLQELSLGYSLPNSMLEKTPFGSLSVTFSANNLWFHTPNMPENTNFDPNVAMPTFDVYNETGIFCNRINALYGTNHKPSHNTVREAWRKALDSDSSFYSKFMRQDYLRGPMARTMSSPRL